MTPIPRPTWLKITAPVAVVGVFVWPVLAMLGLLGTVPAQAVLYVGVVTAALAYVSISRIKRDRAIALGAAGEPDASDEGV